MHALSVITGSTLPSIVHSIRCASNIITEGIKNEAVYGEKIFGSDMISIEILADESEWQTMLDNAVNEAYIMADVIVNGTTFQNVGIRTKGNSRLTQVASSDSDRYSFRI